MRIRSGILFITLGLACAGEPTVGPAVRLGEQALTADRLAELLILAQPLPLEMATATDLAQHWMEVSLVAAHSSTGDSLLDPAAMSATMAPEIRELRIGRLLEESGMEAKGRAEAMTDSVYAAGEIRLLAHVFRRVVEGARPGEKEFQRIAAEQVHQRLVAGGSWAEAVTQSEDPNTRDRDGVIGLVRRGQLPPQFEAVAFSLGPGELSSVVETDFGFHVIRRPGLAEGRATFARLLADELAADAEAEIGARLLAGARLAVLPDAASRTKDMGRDPWSGLERTDVLVRHDDGRLVGGDVARALLLLDPAVRDAITRASDVEVEGFLREIVLRDLLAARADSAGLSADTTGTGEVAERYRDAIEAVWLAANISPDSLAATSAGGDLGRLAVSRVDEYIEALAARRVELAAVPPLLTVYLLQNVDWILDETAIEQAVARARRMLAAADAR